MFSVILVGKLRGNLHVAVGKFWIAKVRRPYNQSSILSSRPEMYLRSRH